MSWGRAIGRRPSIPGGLFLFTPSVRSGHLDLVLQVGKQRPGDFGPHRPAGGSKADIGLSGRPGSKSPALSGALTHVCHVLSLTDPEDPSEGGLLALG